MTVYFAKSLDRPVDIFGIKGKWVTIFLVAAGLSVIFAIVVGCVVSSGAGIASFLVLAAISFVACIMMQGKVSHRQVSKVKASNLLVPHVNRRETIGRILLPDPRTLKFKE